MILECNLNKVYIKQQKYINTVGSCLIQFVHDRSIGSILNCNLCIQSLKTLYTTTFPINQGWKSQKPQIS